MQYISTRDSAGVHVSAAEAIIRGIAPDGGLYVPCEFPAYMPQNLPVKNYTQLAAEIFSLYLEGFDAAEIARLAYGSGAFPPGVAPCHSVGPFEILELFHGPTAAFKDMALQALPHLLTRSVATTGCEREVVILVATSGDTGKAALEGFKDVPGCRVIVFYPLGGVSEMQERQMLTTEGSNTFVLALHGNFDDCQRGVKQIFADENLRERLDAAGMSFSSANSINIGRLLPQIIYYYYAYGQLLAKGKAKPGQSIDIAVPTGNFGNILAAYYAKLMGLPVRRLICASNENDVLAEAIASGYYNSRRPFFKTASPSMDILVSSNFERFLFEMYGRDAGACATALQRFSQNGSLRIGRAAQDNWQGLLYGGSASGGEAARAIATVFQEHHYLLDPHTAVGWAVAGRYQQPGDNTPMLLAATASPYKFPAAVLNALGVEQTGLSGPEQLSLLQRTSAMPIPAPLVAAAQKTLRPRKETRMENMAQTVLELLRV